MFIHKDWQLIYPLVIFVCELYIFETYKNIYYSKILVDASKFDLFSKFLR